MYAAIDGDLPDIGPKFDNNFILCLYFIMFMLIATYFFLNLFIGAVVTILINPKKVKNAPCTVS